jgi:prepilin-type N-terminal cleavage/methylation domain-containing protein
MKRLRQSCAALMSDRTHLVLAPTWRAGKAEGLRSRETTAYTLIELLVVLGVIGILASITLPAVSNMRKVNTMVAAGRQLVDDISLARARAISERTIVHVVFVPPEIQSLPLSNNPRDAKLHERLKSSEYTGYALYAERTVGDQPGRPRGRYLTSWRSLPDGVFMATNKFVNNPALANLPALDRPLEYVTLPFPTVDGMPRQVPHIAFDPQGRLVSGNGSLSLGTEVIPLARGSIFYFRTPGDDGTLNDGTLVTIDVRESPRGNSITNFHRVVVDGLTGRARVETPQIQ